MAILVTCEACKQTLRVRDEYLGKKAWCPDCHAPITLTGERVPNHEVFISYSNKDKHVADAICAKLEALPLRCWIAPRDVAAGHSWGSSIIDAIEEAKVMVLVYSGSSNLSPQVIREVERAVSKGLVLVPFRIETTTMSKDMEYFLSASHWIDAVTSPMENHLVELGELVRSVLFRKEKEAAAAQKPAPPVERVRQSQPASKRRLWPVAAALLLAGLGIAGWWFESKSTKHEATLQPATSIADGLQTGTTQKLVEPAASNSGQHSMGPKQPAKDVFSANPGNAGKDSDWFVELDGVNGFYASPAVPAATVAALEESQKENVELRSFTFTPYGGWIIWDSSGVEPGDDAAPGQGNDNGDWPNHLHPGTKLVAFSPKGPYVILDGKSGLWGPGSSAWVKVHQLGHEGREVRSLAYGPNNSYVVLIDKTEVGYEGIPTDLARVLDQAATNKIVILCVAFRGSDWFCLAENNWWTSNTNLPAAKIISQRYQQNLSPKWIAFPPTPTGTPDHFKTWKYKKISQSLGQLQDRLVLWYTFDSPTTNGQVADFSRFKNNGLVTDANWTRDGHHGGGFEFSANDSYITVPNNVSLNPANLTLAAWIKTSFSDRVWRRIFDKGTSEGYVLSMCGDDKGKSYRGQVDVEPGKTYAISGGRVDDGNWHQVVGTFDGKEAKIYVDGKLAGNPKPWEGKIPFTHYDLTIGANRSNPDPNLGEVGASFDGVMDDVMMFDRAFTEEEVRTLYEVQK